MNKKERWIDGQSNTDAKLTTRPGLPGAPVGPGGPGGPEIRQDILRATAGCKVRKSPFILTTQALCHPSIPALAQAWIQLTNGSWGTWGSSRSLRPAAARLSEGVRQEWVPWERTDGEQAELGRVCFYLLPLLKALSTPRGIHRSIADQEVGSTWRQEL